MLSPLVKRGLLSPSRCSSVGSALEGGGNCLPNLKRAAAVAVCSVSWSNRKAAMGLFDDGDDDGGSSFLANIHKEQKKLDNLAPSSKISDVKVVVGKGMTGQAKKAGRFATAADDDDDDLFAEFDVDMDMDANPAPPAKLPAAMSEDTDNMAMHVETSAPAPNQTAEGGRMTERMHIDENSLDASHKTSHVHPLEPQNKAPQSGVDAHADTHQSDRETIAVATSPEMALHTLAAEASQDATAPTSVPDLLKVQSAAQPAHPAPMQIQATIPSAPDQADDLTAQQRPEIVHEREERQVPDSSQYEAQSGADSRPAVPDAPVSAKEVCAEPESDLATNQHLDVADAARAMTDGSEETQHRTAAEEVSAEHISQAAAAPTQAAQPTVQAHTTFEAMAQDACQLSKQDVLETGCTPTVHTEVKQVLPEGLDSSANEPSVTEAKDAEHRAHEAEQSDVVPDQHVLPDAVPSKAANAAADPMSLAVPNQAVNGAINDSQLPSSSEPQISTAKPLPRQPVNLPAAVMPGKEPTQQTADVRPSFPVPTARKPPLSAAKQALTPLSLPQNRTPFRTDTCSTLSAPAPKAVNMPVFMRPSPKAADKALSSASKASTVSAGASKAGNALPAQTSTKQTAGHSLTSLTHSRTSSFLSTSTGMKAALSGGMSAMPGPFKATSLAQIHTKPCGTGAVSFSALPKQPARTCGGGTKPSSLMSPPSGLTPLQAGTNSRLSGVSHLTGLPATPLVARPPMTSFKSAATPALPFKLPMNSVQNATEANAPTMPMTASAQIAPAASPSLTAAASLAKEQGPKQGVTEQQQHAQGDKPGALVPAGTTETAVPAMHNSAVKDIVMQEEDEGGLPKAKPWTSTSLAGGLMGNMKNLEAMLLEVQQMRDDILECKVDVAISSNRLTRLDNPIVHDKLKSLKRQAEMVFQSAAEE